MNWFKFSQRTFGIKPYPFAEKQEHYLQLLEKFGPESLYSNLKDAREAQKAQEDIERAGGAGVDKDSGWRADDVITICQVLKDNNLPIPPK